MADPVQWSHFGWQGIQFDVPADWNLAVVNGEYESGYLRLDDDEMVRLELKWEGRRNRLPVDKVVKKYLKEMERKAKKAKAPFEARNLNIVSLDGHEHKCMSVRSDLSSATLACRCKECGRVVLARLLYQRGQSGKTLAKRVFSSLKDHAEDGELVWQFFDFRYATPEGFVLERTSLKTGCIEMHYSKKRDEVEVCRAALAQVLLKRRGLKSWFEEFYGSRLKPFVVRVEDATYRGHKALECMGRTSIRKNPFSGLQRRRYFHCRAWRCSETDKIYVFRLTSTKEADERFETFCDKVACH